MNTENPYDEAAAGTLLVVDDEAYDRTILATLLSRRGYTVHAAEDGGSACRQARARLPELILLDVNLTDMDGYEVCRRLKADEATQSIPVIFISGADDVEAKVRAFKAGGVDYITKPFYSEEVLARVGTHLALFDMQRSLKERVRQRNSVLAVANDSLRREIADRQQAELRFRAILEAAPDALVIVDERRRIALVNSRAEDLFGYDRGQLLGQPVEMLMPERFRAAHAKAGEGYAAKPAPRPMGEELELFGLHRDGREFPLEISLSPLATGGRSLVISAIRDISPRKRIEQELLESRRRLQGLGSHREMVREEERKRIAGELHDALGSSLTALKMDISLLRMQLEEKTGSEATAADAPNPLERLGQMRDLVENTIRQVRQVATRLRPAALNLGLVPALEWLVEDFQRRAGVACTLAADREVELGDAQATAVFRIVQESLTNVVRHAEAGRVDIQLACGPEAMELAVRDDGRGFDPVSVDSNSFGLLGIRERARMLGGEARVESRPGEGCRVGIRIPLAAAEAP